MKILLNPSYEESERIRFDYFRKEVLEHSEERESVKLLDIGCSQLDFSNNLNKIESFGIDINSSNHYDDQHFKNAISIEKKYHLIIIILIS